MLKWLVAGKEGEEVDLTITEDPLATLNLKKLKKRTEIYSVNRFNPLFEEEVLDNLDISDSMSDEPETISSGGTSSGYGSNTGPLNLKREEKSENEKPLVTKTMLINLTPAGTSKNTNHNQFSVKNGKESNSPVSEIPTPVWPGNESELRGSLPLKSGHVADQVQKLNVIHQQEPKITRNRDFVTSISVENDNTESNMPLISTASTGKRSDNMSGAKVNKPRRNSIGGQIIYQSIVPTKQSVILGARKSNQLSNNSTLRKAKVRSNRKVNNVKRINTSGSVERAWPGNKRDYSGRSSIDRVPGMLRTPEITDRCFGIRHSVMSPIGEDAEKDTRQHDSIVTNSLLVMTSPTDSSDYEKHKEEEAAHQDKEDTDTRMNELTRAVIKNKHAVTLSRAITHARQSFRSSKRSLRGSKRRRGALKSKEMRGSSRVSSRAGSLRSGSGVEAVRELWERTGMKTNGRKLLIESEEEAPNEILKPDNSGYYNRGYESDGSEVSVPRMKGMRKLPVTRHMNSGSHSSASSYDSIPRSRPRLVRNVDIDKKWEVDGITRVNGLDTVDLDTVHLENDSDTSTKHVRFSSNTPATHSRIGVGELDRGRGVWERYYGATVPHIMEAGLGPGKVRRKTTHSSDLTMDHIKTGLLRRKEKKRKNLRCFCKMFCFLLLLTSFLLVIVTVSIFLTKGRNYFGAL